MTKSVVSDKDKETLSHTTLATRLLAKQTELLAMREQLTLQRNGLENQLFLIDQLLNPEAYPNVETPEQVEEGPTPEPGKI